MAERSSTERARPRTTSSSRGTATKSRRKTKERTGSEKTSPRRKADGEEGPRSNRARKKRSTRTPDEGRSSGGKRTKARGTQRPSDERSSGESKPARSGSRGAKSSNAKRTKSKESKSARAGSGSRAHPSATPGRRPGWLPLAGVGGVLAVAGLGFAFTRGGDDAPESREAGHVQAGVEPTPSASESKLQEAVVAELEVDRRGKPSPLDPPPLPTDAASWRAALSHRNPYVVREALRLRGPWVSESIEALLAATSGPRDEDTLEVVLALRELDPSAYLPALERGLEDPERADPVRALLTALGDRAAPLAQKLQAYLVEGASAEEQLELAHLVADLGGPGAREALERLEQEAGKDRYARMAGKAALERLAAPEDLPSDLAGLGAALARGTSGTRLAWRALDALGARELSRADVQTLTQTLGDASLAVLGVVLAKPAHVAQLRELLADPRPEAQRLAAQALSRLGPAAQDTVAPLRALLTSKHDAVRMDAAAALGAIGPAASAARSDLEPLLEAEDVGGMFNVNVDEPAARFALGRLGGS